MFAQLMQAAEEKAAPAEENEACYVAALKLVQKIDQRSHIRDDRGRRIVDLGDAVRAILAGEVTQL